MAKKATVTALEPVSNDASPIISFSEPYSVSVTVRGTVPILFHRWSVEGVKEKADSPKGSKAKKTDDLESFVWRSKDGGLFIPGKYFRGSIVNAAKFKQDPRSPRKSMMDLCKAAIVVLSLECPLGVKTWDYISAERVQIQRNAVTRHRPAINAGWETTIILEVLLPEYIPQNLLHELIANAGKLVGVGDDRPSYGRFAIVKFKVL